MRDMLGIDETHGNGGNSEQHHDEDNAGAADVKIGLREKMSFFSTNMGNIPIMTLINGFLLIFYVDIIGLNPAAVATLFLLVRLLDGIMDPIMGYIIDHLPATRWGRFRPYIVIGTIVCGLNFLLLWLGPSLASSNKLLIAYIAYICTSIAFDLMDIPLNSIIPVLTTNEKERGSLAIIKMVGYGVGAILFTVPIVPFVLSFPTQQLGYHAVVIIAVLFVVGFSALGTSGIKERVLPASKERYKGKEFFKIFSLVPVIGLFIATLLLNIASSAISASALFYFTYIPQDPALYSTFSILILFMTAVGGISAFFLIQRLGNKNIWVLGTATSVFLVLPVLFIPSGNAVLVMLFIGIGRIGSGFAAVVTYAMQADLMDYVEWKRGFRSEGAIASTFSFIVKAGGGIGTAIPGYILAATGFIPNLFPQASPALLGIDLSFIVLPLIFTAVSIPFIVLLYPISKRVCKQFQLDLQERRNASRNLQQQGGE